ncbi:hypothetical protein PF005_g31927 [Phytophthora fragariae]|uniref:Uncharacterized protein n=1 Tax=Phytophthora fragariae TaxID=53985 RepID=A0A6A3V4P8_9STRA|nr:hypothetical protein PF005_g31927 [Phytophthora fragariae]
MLPATREQKLGVSLRATGVHLCNVYGGVIMLEAKAAMVSALHQVSYFRGKITQKWRGRRLWLETSSRRGPLWRAALDAEAQRTVA